MRTRPWPLVLLALAQILSPVFTVLFNAWVLDVHPRHVLGWIFLRSPLEIFESLLLMPIAGIAIYRMKRGSYAIFFAALTWALVSNFKQWSYASHAISLPAIVGMYVAQLALAGYFLMPSVRRTYFDPRVRWWESKPRYELKAPAVLEVGSEKGEGELLNVSEGGAFLATARTWNTGEKAKLTFWIMSQEFQIEGRVVHARELSPERRCYGIEFIHTPESQKRFRGVARGLAELGFQDRTPRPNPLKDLRDWAVRLVKTGKGWTPEIRS